MSVGHRPIAGEVPVAEPTDELPRPGRSGTRGRRRVSIAVVALLCVAAVAIPVAIRETSSSPRRTSRVAKHHGPPKSARVQVGAALAASVAARSYRIKSLMVETDAPGSTRAGGLSVHGVTINAEATVNVDPLAMVASADVGSLGKVTSWTDSTRVWEQGGANYGLTAGAGIGPGRPISGFTQLVVGSLGRREGGMAMMSFASPHGYLNLADQAITDASRVGTTTVDGEQLTEYDVTFDAAKLLSQPGMSPEQVVAGNAGLDLLRQEGYVHTTSRLDVDTAGYVRRAQTSWGFADGGTVTTDVTYSDYGCAGTVVLPTQAPSGPPASTCTSPDPAATTPISAAG